MTVNSHADTAATSGLVSFVRWTIDWMEAIPYWLIALAARIFPAAVFWYSGQTKVVGWQIWHLKDSAIALFEDEYQVPLLDPLVAAHLAATALSARF